MLCVVFGMLCVACIYVLYVLCVVRTVLCVCVVFDVYCYAYDALFVVHYDLRVVYRMRVIARVI